MASICDINASRYREFWGCGRLAHHFTVRSKILNRGRDYARSGNISPRPDSFGQVQFLIFLIGNIWERLEAT
jgi:hypothetical protein